MTETWIVRRLVLSIAVIVLAFTSSVDADSVREYADTPIVGHEKSRYPDRSPFWEVAEAVHPPESSMIAPGFRFTWGDRAWYAEGAVAMAATVTLQQFVGLGETHRAFCSGERNCDMVDFETRRPDTRFTVRRLLPLAPEREHRKAVDRCQKRFTSFREELRTTLASSRGVVLGVYRKGAFGLVDDGVENHSIHVFAMYGIDRGGQILLRDAADRVPVTYRLRAGRECEALTIPRGFEVEREASSYRDWALTAWIVETRNGSGSVAPPSPTPNPTPRPIPAPPQPVIADDVPGLPGQDPFDLGEFRLPLSEPAAHRALYSTIGGAPTRLQLRAGVAQASARASQNVLTRLEQGWGVTRDGESIRYQPRSGNRTPLSDAYFSLGKSERIHLERLSRKFEVAARKLSKDRVWLAASVIRFVQSIPYELIHEDPIGLRAPVSVLSRNAGDCDSKSLLAAVLLRMLGFQTVVLTNDRLSHAVLGVELPVKADAYVNHEGRRFALVECTNPFPIGDLGASGTRGEARRFGWEVHAVEI